MHDGFGRTSGKGRRMIVVHTIAKNGLFGSLEIVTSIYLFPIPEGSFKPRANDQGQEGSGNLCEMPTAEFPWQAKCAKWDYHGAMTDMIFIVKMRLIPIF